jgi:hypothetical protein
MPMFLIDHCCEHHTAALSRRSVLALSDVDLDETATDHAIVDAAHEAQAIIITENRRDFRKVMRQCAEQSGGPARSCFDGYGVLSVPNGYRRLDLADVRRRMKMNGRSSPGTTCCGLTFAFALPRTELSKSHKCHGA